MDYDDMDGLLAEEGEGKTYSCLKRSSMSDWWLLFLLSMKSAKVKELIYFYTTRCFRFATQEEVCSVFLVVYGLYNNVLLVGN